MTATLPNLKVDASDWPNSLTVEVTVTGPGHSDRTTHAVAVPGRGLTLGVSGGSGWGCGNGLDSTEGEGAICCSMLTVDQARALLAALAEALDWALVGVDPSIVEVTR